MKVPKLPKQIVLDRLILRFLRPDDAESLHVALSDAAVMRYWSTGPHDTLAQTRSYIAGNMPDGEYPALGIAERAKGPDAPAIGWVSLWEKRDGIGEIGYILRPDCRGKGYAREAVATVIDYGFASQGYRKIAADIDPDNRPSLRLLEALGFKQEGVLRAHWQTHIGIRDSVMMGLLESEWQERASVPPGD
ncbi:MAG: GNAT family N-acetyltransferase [Pseudomonadota bacterium]